MSKPIKILNIGLLAAGRIGIMHAENILKIPGVRLKTIYDKYARGKNLRMYDPNIHITKNEAELWEDPDIHAVVIAASSSAHVVLIEKAVRYKKHIFCEKPVSFDSQKLYALSKKVDKAKLLFQVAFNRRFDPDFQAVAQAVREGKVGKLFLIKIVNRDPLRPPYQFIPKSGGLFFDFNSHDFDMIHYVSGEKVKEVHAFGGCLVDPKIAKLGDIDTTLINLKLESGAMASVDCCRETRYGYDQRLEAFGSKASVEAGNVRENHLTVSRNAGISIAKPRANFMVRFAEAYNYQMEDFFTKLRAYLNGKKVKLTVTGFDAARAVAVAEATQKSFNTNRPQKVIYPE